MSCEQWAVSTQMSSWPYLIQKNIRCFRWAKANNSFQDLSAEKDKKRLAVRCWTKFSMTSVVICYLNSHFGEVNSILLSNPKTHGSLLITHYSKSVSSVCQWKFFTKSYFRINPVGKLKVPSWKIFISQLENYFFSVGKSKFRSRAILGDFLGLFLNYFKRFLFILTPKCGLWTKVKMFDSERWAASNEFLRLRIAVPRLYRRHYYVDVRILGLKSPRLFMFTSFRRFRSTM